MLAQRPPEWLEDMLVFDQCADGTAELAEQGVVEFVLGVQAKQFVDDTVSLADARLARNRVRWHEGVLDFV